MGKRNHIRRSYLYYDYYTRLKNIATSIFKWEGLPETCNARFLEETLYLYGRAVFVKDDTMSYLNLKVAPSTPNIYEEPLYLNAFSIGYNKTYSREECVYMRNNYSEKSTDSTIVLFAERLALLEMAISVNLNAQKTPVLLRCDDKTKLTLERLYSSYEGDSPVIFGHKSLQERPLEVLKTDAPFVADKLREEKRMLWNEVFEFLGINTNPSDKKKERLITGEVESNNEQISAQLASMLLCRQEACEEINKKYPLDVSVDLRFKDGYEGGEKEWQNTQSNLEA